MNSISDEESEVQSGPLLLHKYSMAELGQVGFRAQALPTSEHDIIPVRHSSTEIPA